ncbi:hypothetical protein SprV_1002808400 [Sparganum proliferum]
MNDVVELRHRHRTPAPSEDQHQPRPPTLSLHETIRTVQQLSSGKAPASDASSAEVYKHDGPQFMEHLMALFQEMWRHGEVPQDFKGANIIYLFKRIGNRQLCGNHRGICLLNIAGKIFAHILLNRLHNYLDQSVLAKCQCGFRRYRGTKDRIFAARQLQKKRQEMRTHRQFTFMDPPTKGTAPLLSADGDTLLTETTQILQRWAEHFPGVLNLPSAINDAAIDRLPQVETNADLDLPPSLQETIRAVQQLSSGKAPGSDAIPAEVYKHGCPQLMDHLTALFQEMWRQGEVPQDFKDATIVHLYKRKGNRQVCDNHRGISLLNIAGKIFTRILLNRLNNHLEQGLLPESQCGFRRHRGTTDMIVTARQLQERCQEMRTHLYSTFVDLTKAFDTVNREGLWKIMQKFGFP